MSTNILLVHGAAHDENCWNELVPQLEKLKLKVHTLTLRGHGANRKNAYRVSMNSYAKDVCNKAQKIGKPCVLVGHSMGGMVITAAAQARPELFKQMIYLSAFAPPKTPTCIALYAKKLAKLCPEHTSPTPKLNLLNGTGNYDADTSIRMLYNQCEGDLQALVKRNICPQPLRPFLSLVRWSDKHLGSIPKDYIECTQDNALPIETQRAMQANMHFNHIETLNSDHSPFTSMPTKLAAVIAKLVN
ncbi:MAG: alpha/beta hydrolase [Gammaproteobacteria bacterium]|nr:alpha/beta hydrolase [Gammaproteobacteria bacterium]